MCKAAPEPTRLHLLLTEQIDSGLDVLNVRIFIEQWQRPNNLSPFSCPGANLGAGLARRAFAIRQRGRFRMLCLPTFDSEKQRVAAYIHRTITSYLKTKQKQKGAWVETDKVWFQTRLLMLPAVTALIIALGGCGGTVNELSDPDSNSTSTHARGYHSDQSHHLRGSGEPGLSSTTSAPCAGTGPPTTFPTNPSTGFRNSIPPRAPRRCRAR